MYGHLIIDTFVCVVRKYIDIYTLVHHDNAAPLDGLS